jgi:hypothetical protein
MGVICRMITSDLQCTEDGYWSLKEDDAREGLGERCVYTLEGWGRG